MEELIRQLDVDWGASGAQWTGLQVQNYIKSWFREIATQLQSLESGGGCDCENNGGSSQVPDNTELVNTLNQNLIKLQEKVIAFIGNKETPDDTIQSLQTLTSNLKTFQAQISNLSARVDDLTSSPQEPSEGDSNYSKIEQEFKSLQRQVKAFLGESEYPTDGKDFSTLNQEVKELQEKTTAYLGESNTPPEGQGLSFVIQEITNLKNKINSFLGTTDNPSDGKTFETLIQDLTSLQNKVKAFLGDSTEPKDGKTYESIVTELKNLQNKTNAFLGNETQPKEGESLSEIATELKTLTSLNLAQTLDLLKGKEQINSVTAIQATKKYYFAEISTSQKFAITSTPSTATEIHVLIHNTGSSQITVTLPSSGSFVCLVDTALTIEANGYAEVNALSINGTMYLRAIS